MKDKNLSQSPPLLNSIRTSQIPNAWLFHGPVGIGKASLALNVAKVLSNSSVLKENSLSYLSEKDIRNPNASLQVTNIFFCKRKWDDKKKLFQKNISIDDIRELGRKFYLSSADYSYKVCIVDTTEDLNISASNSLLKCLKNPKKYSIYFSVKQQAIYPANYSFQMPKNWLPKTKWGWPSEYICGLIWRKSLWST